MTAKKGSNTASSFEESLKRLEKIVEALENGDVPLDDALKMYEEGIALSQACIEKLSAAEAKFKKLSRDMKGNLRAIEEDIQFEDE